MSDTIDQAAPDRFNKPEDSIGYRLWHVLHAYQRSLEQAFAGLDLTHLQYVLLWQSAYLAHCGEVPSQARIAAAAGLDKMMVSKVVRLLEEKNYVTRSPHPDDPRANRVDVTPAGRAILREALPRARATHDRFFGCLGPEKDHLGALLDELMAARVTR
ncbi:MAG TPA: MarR family transcriptional regulator [Aliidongia sp.]|nr:MarR family transcriptional regulator [Aliidongia sp.]